MKKYLVWMLVAVTALLASCTQEELIADLGGNELTTITVSLPQSSLVTRAGSSEFGDPTLSGMRVTLFICNNEKIVYTEEKTAQDLTGSNVVSFTARLVKGQEYQFAAWCDFGSTYYTLDTTLGSTPTVSMASNTVTGSSNIYDAYFANQEKAITQNDVINLVCQRPFALVKVNTTDWDEPTVKNAGLRPTDYTTTINVPTSLNLLDGETSNEQDVSFAASTVNYDADGSTKELHYDYILANTAKSTLPDFTVYYKQGETGITDYTFQNIPVQRNYQTNITGNILTKVGTINVTIDPAWAETIYQVDVKDIQSANQAIAAQVGANNKNIDVNFTEEPNDAGTPGTDDGARAILTTPLLEKSTLSINVQSDTKTLYVGDYESETNTTLATSGTNAAIVNINVPTSNKIEKLVINAPSKTVYVNGKLVSNSGTITDLEATVSQSTLIIESGQTVGTLTIHQGGLEIHGTVTTVVVNETAHETNPVRVRDCEGLSKKVYDVLTPYIDVDNGYFGEQESGKSTYCIRREVVAKIGDNEYYTLAQAFAEVKDGETITLTKNCETGSQYVLTNNMLCLGQDNATLDLNSYEITVTNNFSFAITANNVTVKNGKISAGATPTSGDDYRKCGYHSFSLVVGAMSSGSTITDVHIEDVTFKGGISFGGSSDNLTSQCTGAGCGTLKNCQITSGMSAAIYAQQNGSAAVVLSGTYNKHSDATNPLVCTEANTSVSLKGGTYNVDPTNWVASGYEAKTNGTSPETWTVVEKPMFSVSATKKVEFSKGNLYWDGNAYHFEENQWDYPTTYSASHVGHFYWSKSLSVACADGYSESGTSVEDALWCGENSSLTVAGQSGWYNPTGVEWYYILKTRSVNGGTGEGYACQRTTLTLENSSTVVGLIIVPDNYSGTPALSTTTSWADWQTMEAAGCIFLPAAGSRSRYASTGSGYEITERNDHGYYWYNTPHSNVSYAYNLDFKNNFNLTCYGQRNRYQGQTIRLAHN